MHMSKTILHTITLLFFEVVFVIFCLTGMVYVNGEMIGRYWNITATGSCQPCDYRGTYEPFKCLTGRLVLLEMPDDSFELSQDHNYDNVCTITVHIMFI